MENSEAKSNMNGNLKAINIVNNSVELGGGGGNQGFLRIVAAVMVFMVHFFQYFGNYGIVSRGATGVQLFFCLSGYLIMVSLSHNNLGEYIKKRIVRIVPIYYIALLSEYICDWIWSFFIEKMSVASIFSTICNWKYIIYFVFGQGVIPTKDYFLWNNRYALWTMSSFFVFYVLAPIFFKFVHKFEVAFIITAGLMLFRENLAQLISVMYANYPATSHIEWFKYQFAINEMYCFFLGSTIYYALKDKKEFIYILILGAVALYSGFSWYPNEIIITLLVMGAITWPGITNNENIKKVIHELSNMSFTLYLFHPILLKVFMKLFNWKLENNFNIGLFTLCATMIGVACIYYGIEKKVNVKLVNDKVKGK